MKKHLLVWLISLLPFSALAQVNEAVWLLGNGIGAGAKAMKNRANKPGEFTTYFRAEQDSVPMKRTPENKLRGDAASEIRKLEAYLQQVHEAYRKPSVESICPDAQTGDYLISTINSRQPKWDTGPYVLELGFYKKEHGRRYTAARVAEQQQREAQARRQQAARDSLDLIAQRQRIHADSVREAVALARARIQARLDSIELPTRQARAAELNRALLTDAGRRALDRGNGAPSKPASARTATKSAKGPVVYMCNSGNSVKYHSSPDCRGLNRCGSSVVRIGKAEAQQSMDACRFCY
jgi:hypothetical protein